MSIPHTTPENTASPVPSETCDACGEELVFGACPMFGRRCDECGRAGGSHKLDCGTGRKPVMGCPGCGRNQTWDVRNHRPDCRMWADTAAWHPEWSRYCLAPGNSACPIHG